MYVYLVNFTRIQSMLKKLPKEEYRIILLRRMYLRFGDVIAKKYGYKSFVTGDALGQVASQTMESMEVISSATNKVIYRPLVAMAKEEIINIARKIGTLEISNLPGDDMCELFAPEKPIIHPKLEDVLEQEKLLDDYEKQFTKIIKEDMRIIKLGIK